MSAGVTGQGTPSAGYHFPNGVLKCDSQCLCVCVCVCSWMSDLRVSGGRQTELSSPFSRLCRSLCHAVSPLCLILSFWLNFLSFSISALFHALFQLSSPSPKTDLAGIEGYQFKSSSCFSLNENDLIIKILSDNKKSDNTM